MSNSAHILTHDLHVHLYGCLNAATIHTLGESRWQSKQQGLEWYATEFTKAHGRSPPWQDYWSSRDGVDLLTQDYQVRQKTSFPRFQASFNLLIALFPLDSLDRTVLEAVLAVDQSTGVRYCEYRTILPVAFDETQFDLYLRSNCEVVERCATATFDPRLALSLPRDPENARNAYERLRHWMNQNPTLAKSIVAIDFSGFEEGDPALSKFELFRHIREENQKSQNPLSILLHVGETWETLSPLSALRRVWESAFSGAHRLGHATIAGIETPGLRGRTFHNQRQEWERDLMWLKRIATSQIPGLSITWLTELIDEVNLQGLQWDQGGQGLPFKASEPYLNIFSYLQDVVLKDLGGSPIVIESCPTSNLFLSGLEPARSHPLARFVSQGVKTVIGRDDPGLFGSTFATEEKFCREIMELSHGAIEKLQMAASTNKAANLAKASFHHN